MKVLITGGYGFLGRWYYEHHRAQGDRVRIIDNMSSAGARQPETYHPNYCDGWDLEKALNEPSMLTSAWDLAYHFAAPVGGREKIEGDPLYNADSLRLDSVFFRWAIGRVKTVVYPSSSAVYGVSLQGEKAVRLKEIDFIPAEPVWLAPDEMYGFTKLAGERLAFAAAKYGLNTLCIRPFSGYGEGQSFDYPIPSIARRALRREDPIVVWGPGTQQRDLIHVSDLVGGTIARLNAGIEGYQTLNLGSGVGVSFNEVAQACAEIVGYYPRIINDASKPVGVLNRISDPTQMLVYYTPKVSPQDGLGRVLASL